MQLYGTRHWLTLLARIKPVIRVWDSSATVLSAIRRKIRLEQHNVRTAKDEPLQAIAICAHKSYDMRCTAINRDELHRFSSYEKIALQF